jgi:hypothetical protein
VTTSSDKDNLRPIVAAEGDTWALVWLHGEYRTYTDYNQEARALFFDSLPE